MKRMTIKSALLFVLAATLVTSADAQGRRGSRRGGTTPAAGTNPAQSSQQNNNNAGGYDPYGNVPIRVDSSEGSGLDTGAKRSLRTDGAFESRGESMNQRTPLAYEHLRWDDALYAEKVWRELDLREKMNLPFRFKAQDDNGDQRFISILLNAVRKGEITTFADDRFTQMNSIQQVQESMGGGGADTTNVTDINDPTKIVERVVTQKTFNPDNVMKLRIKEEWVFDREASRLFCRIVGIAPLRTVYFEGTKRERGTEVMFWVYYPDLRPTLAKYDVYNPKNMGVSRMTWEELFESRMFSSYIIKSTIDNSTNSNIRVLIKDPILALLEGDNIKERIFNYEQDLWSY
jgi:gliding motility associated protien GldN